MDSICAGEDFVEIRGIEGYGQYMDGEKIQRTIWLDQFPVKMNLSERMDFKIDTVGDTAVVLSALRQLSNYEMEKDTLRLVFDAPSYHIFYKLNGKCMTNTSDRLCQFPNAWAVYNDLKKLAQRGFF